MHYPDFSLPVSGDWTQIVPGVLWVRMPLPFDLDHINLYLLEDKDGWFIVDTGLSSKTTKSHWLSILNALSKPLKGVIVTHLHPDHVGLAGWLTEEFNVPLYMSQVEYFMARAFVAGRNGATQEPDRVYFERAGMKNDDIDAILAGNKGFGSVVSPLPVSYNRLKEGCELEINNHYWKVMIGRGHAPEHVCLYCESLGILISGDHVLPSITPNIGVYSTEPEANTLSDYLTTLPQFSVLPEETLVLPAHKIPFVGINERVNTLISHHHEHLDALVEACSIPSTVMDLLPVMFKRPLNGRNSVFAIAECLSHLNYLQSEGKVDRVLDNNKYYYEKVV